MTRAAKAPVALLLVGVSLVRTSSVLSAQMSQDRIYQNLAAEVLLDNERVRVEKFLIPPGESTGAHSRAVGRLLVIVKGGVLASNVSRRAILWKDGSVFWQCAGTKDAGSTNTGTSPIHLIWVTPKPVATGRPSMGQDSESLHVHYPNIPGEDLFENERIIVQRFEMEPGQWEGVHSHSPNSLYVFIRGGQWISRTYRNTKQASGDSPDGSIGWMEPVDIKEGHESGNVGKEPSEVVWVLLKE